MRQSLRALRHPSGASASLVNYYHCHHQPSPHRYYQPVQISRGRLEILKLASSAFLVQRHIATVKMWSSLINTSLSIQFPYSRTISVSTTSEANNSSSPFFHQSALPFCRRRPSCVGVMPFGLLSVTRIRQAIVSGLVVRPNYWSLAFPQISSGPLVVGPQSHSSAIGVHLMILHLATSVTSILRGTDLDVSLRPCSLGSRWLGGRRLWVSHWLSHWIFAPESLDSPFSLGLPSLVPTLSILTPYSCTIHTILPSRCQT